MTDLKNLSDQNLVELLKTDKVSAFEELYDRYWSKLYANAYNRIRSAEVAEEIIQDFFTSLWVNRKSIELRSSFNNYSFAAVRNLVFKYYQKEYRQQKYTEHQKLNLVDIDRSTEQQIDLNDLTRILADEVASLPPKCRGVFHLSRNEYKSNKEIATILEISEKTVETHITKAIKVLRLNLKNISSLILLSSFFH